MLYTLGKLSLGSVRFTRLKPLMLLAYLTLEGQQSRAHLSTLFWSDAKNPSGALSVALSRLRQAHPGSIESDPYSVKSTLPTDALAFLEAAKQGQYKEALTLYKGPFLAGVALPNWSAALETWVYTTREMLALEAQTCLLKLAQRYAEEGRTELAAQYAETAYALSATPALEPKTLALIFRLLEQGGHEAANAVAAEAEELGFTLIKSDASKTSRVNKTTLHNLPTPNSSFVGRQDELTTLNLQLSDPNCRLLTLMGPGGVGKSRLALSLAYTQLTQDFFDDGVYLVALESLQSADLVPTRIAEALELSLKGRESPLNSVTSFISKKKILLVLDNIEHLPESTSTLSILLTSCLNLKVLVTSRARLHSRDEWVFQLGGLSYPAQSAEGGNPFDYDAPKLFAERAKQSRLDLIFTPDDYKDMARLCDLIGGLPLALEFAAAWLSAMSLSDVVQEVEQGLELLRAAHRDVDARHQSMAGVFAQSWQRLSVEDQTALRRLSVFEGGFTREAAKEVVGVGLEQLMNLIFTSFVILEKSGRYSFHPLTKQYLKQQLHGNAKDYQEVENRHARYFLTLAKEAEPKLKGEEQKVWLEKLDRELDNIRVVLARSISHKETDTALSLAGTLKEFWLYKAYPKEGIEWLVRSLKLTGEKNVSVRVKALEAAGMLLEQLGDLDSARAYLEEGINISKELKIEKHKIGLLRNLGNVMLNLGDYQAARTHYKEGVEISTQLGVVSETAKILNSLGLLEEEQGNQLLARACYEKSLAIVKRAGDFYYIAVLLNNLALLEANQGCHSAAQKLYQKSLTIAKDMKNRFLLAVVLNGLGTTEEMLGDIYTAQSYFEESLEIYKDLEDKHGVALALSNLGNLAREQKDYKAAKEYMKESLNVGRKSGVARINILSLENYAALMRELNEFSSAVRVWGSVSRIRQKIGQPLPYKEQAEYKQSLSNVKKELGDETFKAAWEAGRKMTLEEAVAYALN